MKHCPYCGTNYNNSQTHCPTCSAADYKNICKYCGTIYEGEFCSECGLGVHEELAICPKCGNRFKDRICSRCGYDTASTGSIKEAASSVVSKAACAIVGHSWVGCKCTRCGEIRDKDHDFQPVENKCQQKCIVCGKTEKLPHQWKNDKCTRCGVSKGFKEKFWGSINNKLPFLHLEREKNRPIVGGIALLLILFAILGIFALKESPKKASGNIEGEIMIPASASSLEGENYKDVIKRLESAGFSNVEEETLEDLITGWLTKDGEVERVSIDGVTDFSKGQSFPKDSNIIVTYHTFP